MQWKERYGAEKRSCYKRLELCLVKNRSHLKARGEEILFPFPPPYQILVTKLYLVTNVYVH
jgi:hypothetical protein